VGRLTGSYQERKLDNVAPLVGKASPALGQGTNGAERLNPTSLALQADDTKTLCHPRDFGD